MDSSPLNKSKNNTLKGILSLVVLAVIIFAGLYSIQSRYALLNQQQVNQQPNPITPLPANEDLSKKQHIWNITLKLNTKNQKYYLDKIKATEGYTPDYFNQPDGGYTLRVVDAKQKELYTLKFTVPVSHIHIANLYYGNTYPPQFELKIPAQDNAKYIEILDPKNSLIDVRTVTQKKTVQNFTPVKKELIPIAHAQDNQPPGQGPPLSNECPDIPGITNCSTGAYSCPSYFPTCVGGCGMDSHGCSNIGSPPNPPDIPVEPEQPTPPALPPSEIPVVPEATQATSPTPANNQANNCSQIVPNTNEDVTKCNSLPGCKYIYCPSSHSVCAPADTQTRPLQNSDFPGLPLAPSYPGGTNDAVCSGSGSIPQGGSNSTGTGSQQQGNQNPTGQITIVPKSKTCTGNVINLLFVGDKFSSDAEFKSAAKEFMTNLLSTPPFNAYADEFQASGFRASQDTGCLTALQPDISGISVGNPQSCSFNSLLQNIQAPLDRCTNNIRSLVSQYPNDVVVSLNKGTSWIEVAQLPPISVIVNGTEMGPPPNLRNQIPPDKLAKSLEQTAPKAFVHEFGHALGNFGDQYVAVPSQCLPPGQDPWPPGSGKNCARNAQEASVWQQRYGSTPVQGCFVDSYYRLTQDQSIMLGPQYRDWKGPLHYDQVEDDLWKPILDKYKNSCKSSSSTPTRVGLPNPPQEPGGLGGQQPGLPQTQTTSGAAACKPTAQNSVKDARGKVWLSPTCDATTIQGCNGPFIHQGQTAVDFQNPQGACGATVYAPIDAVYQPYTESPIGDHGCKFQYNGNTYILTHFKAQSCNGQLVHQGEPIGVEGCSGLATFKPGGGPCHVHLGPHFYSNHQAPNPFCSVAQNTYGSLPNTNQTDGCFY